MPFIGFLRRFLGFLLGTVVSPKSTLSALASEHPQYGVGLVLCYGFLYVLAAVFLVANRLRPVVTPALPIPEEQYYRWQVVFTLPVTFVGWLVLGATAWFVATRVFGGEGSLWSYLVVLAFAFYVPQMIVVWPPEMIAAMVRPEWWGNLDAVPVPVLFEEVGTVPVYLWIGLAWSFALTAVGVRAVAGTSWASSGVTALISASVSMAFYVLFIR